ncbi:hypothetical protein EV714DRAFT_232616 [Schizophyllum commune]
MTASNAAERARYETEREYMATFLSIRGDVGALNNNPFMIAQDSLHLGDSSVARALDAIAGLAGLLWFVDDSASKARDDALRLLKATWFSLILWIDFLRPGQGHFKPDRAHVQAILHLLLRISYWKGQLSDLLFQTAGVYTWTMWLWLHASDIYDLSKAGANASEDYLDWHSTLSLATEQFILDYQQGEHPILDPVPAQHAFGAVKHKYRRLLTLVIGGVLHVPRLATSPGTKPWTSDALRTVVDRVGLLGAIVVAADLDMGVKAQDMEVLVHLIRTLQLTPGGKEAACCVCDLIFWICNAATDHKPLLWSLQCGIFPLLISLAEINHDVGEGAIDHSVVPLLQHIASRTVLYPIAQAFEQYRHGSSFSMLRIKGADDWASADDIIALRRQIMERPHPARCSNERQDRSRHRLMCAVRKGTDGRYHSSAALNCSPDDSFLTPKVVHFIQEITSHYVEQHMEDILATVRQQIPAGPKLADHIQIHVDFDNQVAPTHSLYVVPRVMEDGPRHDYLRDEEIEVRVFAELGDHKKAGFVLAKVYAFAR